MMNLVAGEVFLQSFLPGAPLSKTLQHAKVECNAVRWSKILPFHFRNYFYCSRQGVFAQSSDGATFTVLHVPFNPCYLLLFAKAFLKTPHVARSCTSWLYFERQ